MTVAGPDHPRRAHNRHLGENLAGGDLGVDFGTTIVIAETPATPSGEFCSRAGLLEFMLWKAVMPAPSAGAGVSSRALFCLNRIPETGLSLLAVARADGKKQRRQIP